MRNNKKSSHEPSASIEELMKEFENAYKPQLQFTRKQLGQGGISQVYEVIINKTSSAAKFIKVEKDDDGHRIENESFILLNLISPYIIKVTNIFQLKIKEETVSLVIMERASFGNLLTVNDFLHKDKGSFLRRLIYFPFFIQEMDEYFLRYMINPIIYALELMQRTGYIHFDIKLKNFLVLKNFETKLSDFNISRNFENLKVNEKNIRIPGGTKGFTSPEYLYKEKIDWLTGLKQDYFGLGVCICQLIYSKNDFLVNNSNESEVWQLIDTIEVNSKKILSDDRYDFSLRMLINQLIQRLPENRPSIEEIIRNKWLNDKEANKAINDIVLAYEGDEEKILTEFSKFNHLNIKNKEQNKFMNQNNNQIDDKYNSELKKNIINVGRFCIHIQPKKYKRMK